MIIRSDQDGIEWQRWSGNYDGFARHDASWCRVTRKRSVSSPDCCLIDVQSDLECLIQALYLVWLLKTFFVTGYVDSEEDEVFFGQQSSKEEQGLKSKNLKLLRRTLQGVIRPQNSPKNVPFNPIQEEDIENNIDAEKGTFLTPLMLKMLNQNNRFFGDI